MNNHILNMLNEYKNKDYYPWHMPGHKRKLENIFDNPYLIDVTEVEGTDDLHDPEDGIYKAMAKATQIYGSKESYYLVNGSTSGLLAAIWTVADIGDKIIMARNCHKSVYNGIKIRGLSPVYIYPEYLEEYNMYGGIDVEDLARCVSENTDAKAIIITSPTYEGIVSNIGAVAKLAHDNNMLLIVDEAHGAHFEYSDRFPDTAIKQGADIVIESLHKTLAAPTQSAIIHSNLTDHFRDRLIEGLKIFQSSSPSYILMAGMDYAVEKANEDRGENYENHIEVLGFFRDQISGLRNIKIMNRNTVGRWAYDYDISKIVLSVKSGYDKVGYTGADLVKELQEEYGQVFEMATLTYAIGMTSIMDSKENFDVLYEALVNIDNKLGDISEEDRSSNRHSFNENIRAIISKYPAQIIENETIYVPLEEGVNRISGKYVYLYPPGIPLIVPGEIITEDIIGCIETYLENGLDVKGIRVENEKIHINVSSIFR